MGVYIKGIEMPKEGNWATIRIYPDGSCAVPNWQGDCTFIKDAKAIPVSSHGDLIDRNEPIERALRLNLYAKELIEMMLTTAPIIIPAEESEYDVE